MPLRAVLCLAALVVLAELLLRLGRGWLDVPLGSGADLQRWFDETPPTTMAAALLRAAGLLSCSYLFTVIALGVLADLAGWRPAARLATRLTPALLRRATRGGAHLGLWAGALAPTAPVVTTALPQLPPPSTVTMVELDVAPPGTVTTVTPSQRLPRPTVTMVEVDDATPPAVATMVRLDDTPATEIPLDDPPATRDPSDDPTATGGLSGEAPVGEPQPTTAGDGPTSVPVPGTPPPGTAEVRTVTPGDSFWSIAEDALREALGRAPSTAEIAPYWRELVDVNRGRLAAPDQPDLLLVGQELRLPAPP